MIDVAIDARRTRRMSVGTLAYLDALIDRVPIVAPDIRLHPVGTGENFSLNEQVALPREIDAIGPQLTHYPTIFAPAFRRQPYVATVHDLIHLKFPEHFGAATAAFYRYVAIPMLRGAAMLLMGDERTIEDCVTYLEVDPQRCRVVPLGYNPQMLSVEMDPAPPRRPFIFYAGNHRPHKNLGTLLAAWSALPEELELDCCITGAANPAALAAYTRRRGQLRYLGDLSPDELVRRYRAALAYVHPALTEGFGIPMLEAAALGTPVIASKTAYPNVVAPVAVTFDPHDVEELTRVLSLLVRNPVPFRTRAAEGVGSIRAYTWDRFAAETAAAYREVVDAHRRG